MKGNMGGTSVFSVESPPPMLGLPEENEEDKLPCDGYTISSITIYCNLAFTLFHTF